MSSAGRGRARARQVRARRGASTRSASPRTTATGRPPSLPLDHLGDRRRSRRRRLGRSRPARCRTLSVRPSKDSSGSIPAAPIARSVWPCRQARPAVSLTRTATLTPGRVLEQLARRRRARRVGVDRAGARPMPGSTFDASTPAAAITTPRWLSTIAGGAAPGDHPHRLVADRLLPVPVTHHATLGLADHLAGHHHHVSVLERDGALDEQRARSVARSRPRRCRRPAKPADAATLRARPGRARRRPCRGGVVVGHHQRHRPARGCRRLDALDQRGVDGVHQPAVEHAAGRPRAP